MMSERGSFCTEYMYDLGCFKACKQILIENEKYLKGITIPNWTGEGELPIVAGKIGGCSSGSEFITMEMDYIPKIQELMPDGEKIRICVHSDSNGSCIYEFDKHNIKEIWYN
jgi:hypothetical protein